MIEISKMLRLAFCCLAIVHEGYELYLYKWQSEEERRTERGYAWTYTGIIIIWSLTEMIAEII